MSLAKPYHQSSDRLVTVYCGDARAMDALADASVQLIVTSPPYWDLKNYGQKRERPRPSTGSEDRSCLLFPLGLGQFYGEYLTELGNVVHECHRVLQPKCFLCWVIGTRVSDGDMKHTPAESIRILEGRGFTFKKEIIWVKPKGTQGLGQRGTTQFLKKTPFPTCGNVNIQHEYILILRREGEFALRTDYRLPAEFIKNTAWSVWKLPVSMTQGHPAPFPLEIPRRLIMLYSWPGETVLDPFLGTGTTLRAARELGRKGVGYEFSEKYCQLAVGEHGYETAVLPPER